MEVMNRATARLDLQCAHTHTWRINRETNEEGNEGDTGGAN